MKKSMDDILKHALSPKEEPEERLNLSILQQAKERTYMARKKKKNRVPAAVLAAAFTLMIGSAAVYAGWKYLAPEQVADEVEDQKLMEAFTGSDAVIVNESQESGGYKVTLLGFVAGKNISDRLVQDDRGELKDDMIYTVVAIERADGAPMPDTSDDAYGEEPFYVSHYIKGLDPAKYSLMSMGGGYTEFVREGIQYRLLEMDNIEMFADRGIYVGVSSGTFYDSAAYMYDEHTGEMQRNEDYPGVNALFTLPLDQSKADPETADSYLKELEASWESDSEGLPKSEEDLEVDAWYEKVQEAMKEGNIDAYAERVESTVKVCKPDGDGVITYSYDLGGDGSGSGMYADELTGLFPDKKPGSMASFGYSYGLGLEDLILNVAVLNEDGTVTCAVYRAK